MANTFHYKTSVGMFWIKPQPQSPGRFLLGIDDVALGSYASPMLAADDMYMHVTGWSDWDDLDGTEDGPTDIGEWNRGLP